MLMLSTATTISTVSGGYRSKAVPVTEIVAEGATGASAESAGCIDDSSIKDNARIHIMIGFIVLIAMI